MALGSTLLVTIGADVGGAMSGIRQVEGAVDGFGKRIGGLGKMAAIGIGAVGATVAGIGVASAKAAIDFESSFAGVRKTVDATEEEFAQLREGFRAMALEKPIDVNELNQIGESAGQLGIAKENILDFTSTMADLAVTTNLTSEQAATSMARFANIMQMPQTEFSRLGSTVVALGNNFATTEAEIMEMAMRIAGAGKQVGLREPEVMGLAAALSSVGIEAEAGGTAISRVMITMANAVAEGGDQLAGFAATAGMSISEFSQLFQQDASAAITAFIEGLGQASEEGENVFAVLDELGLSEIRVRDALLRAANAGGLFREAIELGSEAWEENTALSQEAAERYKTTASQLQLLKNNLTDVAITIGDFLLPVINQAIGAAIPVIQQVGQAIQGLLGSEGVQSFFADIATVAQGMVSALSAAVPVIVNLATGLKDLIQGFLTGGLAGAEQFMAGLERLKDVASTIGDVLQSVIQAVVSWIQQQVPVLLNQLASWGQTFLDWIAPHIPGMLAELGNLAASLFDWAVTQVPSIINTLMSWAHAFRGWVLEAISVMLPELLNLASNLLDWITEQAPPLAERLLGEWVPAFIMWAAEAAVQVIPKLVEFIIVIGKWIVTEGVPKLLNLAWKLGEAIVNGIIKGVTSLAPKLWDSLTTLANDALQAAKDALGISSPSRVFERVVGMPIVQGIVSGVGAAAPQLMRALKTLGTQSAQQLEPTIKAQTETLKQYRDAIGMVERALKPLQSALDSIRDRVTTLNNKWDEARRKIQDLSRAQLIGTNAYSDALWENEQAQAAIQRRLNDLKLAGRDASDAEVKQLEAELDRLRILADNIRLDEQLELGPKRRQLELFDRLFTPEMRFEDAVEQMQEQLDIIGALNSTIPDLERQQAALEAILNPIQTMLNEQKSVLDQQEDELGFLNDVAGDLKSGGKAAQQAFDLIHTTVDPALDLIGQLFGTTMDLWEFLQTHTFEYRITMPALPEGPMPAATEMAASSVLLAEPAGGAGVAYGGAQVAGTGESLHPVYLTIPTDNGSVVAKLRGSPSEVTELYRLIEHERVLQGMR